MRERERAESKEQREREREREREMRTFIFHLYSKNVLDFTRPPAHVRRQLFSDNLSCLFAELSSSKRYNQLVKAGSFYFLLYNC